MLITLGCNTCTGLIPDRGERMDLLKELTRFFTPAKDYSGPSTAPAVSHTLPSISLPEEGSESAHVTAEGDISHLKTNSPVPTTIKWSENKIQKEDNLKRQEPVSGGLSDAKSAGPPISSILRTESPSPYRLHQYGTEKPRHIDHQAMFENDPDYIELLAKYNVKDYYGDVSKMMQSLPRVHRVPQSNGTLGAEYPRRRLHTLPVTGSQWNGSPGTTKLPHSKTTAKLRER